MSFVGFCLMFEYDVVLVFEEVLCCIDVVDEQSEVVGVVVCLSVFGCIDDEVEFLIGVKLKLCFGEVECGLFDFGQVDYVLVVIDVFRQVCDEQSDVVEVMVF